MRPQPSSAAIAEEPVAAPRSESSPAAARAPAPLASAASVPTEETYALASPWPRLRQRYAMPGCNYSPAVQRFAKAMASSPRNLNIALRQAMPFLLLTTAQIEKFDMPGEFAFLPWVESSYTMVPASGDGVAGMWQLMPQTAREMGLRIDADYDGRLDVYASSRTALVLIKQYEEEFGDWRLANMAFNAGVNSVRQAIATHGSTAAKTGRLYLNQTNDEHLTKLLAMACIVSMPARYGVELPEPRADDVPTLITLPAPIDLHLAAQAGGIDYAQLQRWNAAFLKGRMPDGGPYHLLVPAPRRAAIERALGMLPQYTWRHWRDTRLLQPQTVDTLAMAYDLDPQALAAVNRIDVSARLPAGTRLLLPGRDDNPRARVERDSAPALATVAAPAIDEGCTVRSGDTLWDIARRYRLRVEDLVKWNRLSHDATLRLGQRLRLAAPISDALH
ncbi:MAG: LysM peptidoglycan-binding domain-containing protein [Rudaea sp.]